MRFGKQKKTFVHKNGKENNKVNEDQAGINLSALSEVQKKMCVKLLAQGNVQFVQKNDNYIATLRVPTSQLQEFSNKKATPLKEKGGRKNVNNNQKKTNDKKKQPTHKDTQRQGVYHNGKKPLSKAVKLTQISKLQQLHPQVEIYVYPKRMNFKTLIEILENVYHKYWNLHEQDSLQSSSIGNKKQLKYQSEPTYTFQTAFYEVLKESHDIYNKTNKSTKIDQFLVNVLDSIYHFQFKSLGVRLFSMFLTDQYKRDALSYFLVLRALMEGIVGQTILDSKNIYRNKIQHSGMTKKTGYFNWPISKLKWSPYEAEIEEQQVKQFLKVCIVNSNELSTTFEKITELMYFNQKKNCNLVSVFELFEFLLKEFTYHKTTEISQLQLSYSRDSTLNQILFSETNRQQSIEPVETSFQQKMKPYTAQIAEEQFQRNSKFEDEINLVFKEKCREISGRMGIPNSVFTSSIEAKAEKCLEAALTSNKLLWVEATQIKGTESELLYIENLQRQIQGFREINSANLINSFITKIIYGPGLMKLFMKYVNI